MPVSQRIWTPAVMVPLHRFRPSPPPPPPPLSGFGPRSPYPLADLDRIWTAGTPAHETGSLYSFVVHLTKNLSAVEISSWCWPTRLENREKSRKLPELRRKLRWAIWPWKKLSNGLTRGSLTIPGLTCSPAIICEVYTSLWSHLSTINTTRTDLT